MKWFYADYRPNRVLNPSLNDRLMRFESREERDNMIEVINNANNNIIVACEVKITHVGGKYNVRDFDNGDKCTEGYPKTCHNKIYFEIAPRHIVKVL